MLKRNAQSRRLVVDTGLHSKGREQAIKYSLENEESEASITTEIERHSRTALFYKIGQLKIMERKRHKIKWENNLISKIPRKV
jgi:uncharacterized protein (DUF885 family)